jgi:hypothetical protein
MSQITAQELPSPHTMSQLASLLPETSTSSRFPFLKLPAEIRNMIYLLLLSNRSIHILSFQPDNSIHESQYPTNHALRETNSHIDGQSSGNGDDLLSISILLACSRIYNEARLFPYKNAFRFDHGTLLHFLDACTPEQRRLMHSVELIVRLTLNSLFQDEIVKDSMRRAATMLTSFECFKLNILFDRLGFVFFRANIQHLGIRAIWIKLLGAWGGRGLKLGQVTVTILQRSSKSGRWQYLIRKLEEELTAILTANST